VRNYPTTHVLVLMAAVLSQGCCRRRPDIEKMGRWLISIHSQSSYKQEYVDVGPRRWSATAVKLHLHQHRIRPPATAVKLCSEDHKNECVDHASWVVAHGAVHVSLSQDINYEQ
jgi:hypothetical protein